VEGHDAVVRVLTVLQCPKWGFASPLVVDIEKPQGCTNKINRLRLTDNALSEIQIRIDPPLRKGKSTAQYCLSVRVYRA
jgi:hypothetical protein